MSIEEISRERPRDLNTEKQMKWYQHKGTMMPFFSHGSIKWMSREQFSGESKDARASTDPEILANCWRDVRTGKWLTVRDFQSLG